MNRHVRVCQKDLVDSPRFLLAVLAFWGASCLFGLGGFLNATSSQAQEPMQAADLLPATTLVYAELIKTEQIVDLAYHHPLVRRALKSEAIQRELSENRDLQEAQQTAKILEERLGQQLPKAIATLTGGGLSLAFEPSTRGVAVLVKSNDPEFLRKAHGIILELGKADAENKGEEFPVQEIYYRDHQAWRAGDAHWTILGPFLLVTNKPSLGRMIVDQYLDQDAKTLAQAKSFQHAAGVSRPQTAGGWALFRIDLLRMVGLPQAILGNNTNNPGAEMLVGGVIDAFKEATYVTATAEVSQEHITIAAAMPQSRDKPGVRRQFYFAPSEGAGAAAPLQVPGTVLTLTTYRDVAKFWQAAGDMFGEDVMARFNKADSDLTLFFSGRSFSDEILPEIGPRFRFVLARQRFPEDGPQPAIKLPAGALVMELAKGHQLSRRLKIAFQNLVALGNLGAGQQGLPQLDLNHRQKDGAQITSAVYDASYPRDNPGPIPLVYNFSPTLITTEGHAILASSQQVALDALQSLAKADGPTHVPENTLLQISPQAGSTLVQDNREPLIAQNMLENGHTRDEAVGEVDLLSQLLSEFRQISFRLIEQDQQLQLRIKIQFAETGDTAPKQD